MHVSLPSVPLGRGTVAPVLNWIRSKTPASRGSLTAACWATRREGAGRQVRAADGTAIDGDIRMRRRLRIYWVRQRISEMHNMAGLLLFVKTAASAISDERSNQANLVRQQITAEQVDEMYAGTIDKMRCWIKEKLSTLPPGSANRALLEKLQELSPEKVFDELMSRSYPNPERVGCPSYRDRRRHKAR